MPTFQDLLADSRPHLFDGAMGTMLYSKGVFINRCYDELNLVDPDLIKGIHREYVRAGAELLETNSFGANRAKLAQYGLDASIGAINEAAARLAREAAAGRALVGGSMGPLGIRVEPYGPTSLADARAIFREQAEGLAAGGVDFFVLETFSDLQEIHQALLGVRDACDLPVIAQMTVQEDGTTSYGTAAELCAARLDEWGADAIGLNCSVGPAVILEALERIAQVTTRKLAAQPNAGMPREISGRKMYMASPEYMATFAQRLARAGVKFIGGCCGTTPEHIKRMGDAIRSAAPGHARVAVAEAVAAGAGVAAVPLAERSAWGRKLAEGKLVTTVEIVPPRGVDPAAMLAGVRLLARAGVDAVNVPDGPRAQMRMGALPTAALIERSVGTACADVAGSATVACVWPGEAERTASPMRLMCSGVVPQQPPMNLTPARASLCAKVAMYSGDAMYILRPEISRGMPALGCAESLRCVTAAIFSSASRMTAGPTEQLSPITSAPHSSSRWAHTSGDVPYDVVPSSWIVIWATMGSSHASRTASMAWWISCRSLNVSSTKKSTPPSSSPSICSRKIERASSSDVGPYGSMRIPSGPIEPPTSALPAAASRASRAAAALIAPTWAFRPCCASFTRLAPKEFVSSSSAPLFTYSR